VNYGIKQLLNAKMIIEAKMSTDGANIAGRIIAVGFAVSSVIVSVAVAAVLVASAW